MAQLWKKEEIDHQEFLRECSELIKKVQHLGIWLRGGEVMSWIFILLHAKSLLWRGAHSEEFIKTFFFSAKNKGTKKGSLGSIKSVKTRQKKLNFDMSLSFYLAWILNQILLLFIFR